MKYILIALSSSFLTASVITIIFFSDPALHALTINPISFKSEDGHFEYTTIPSKVRDHIAMEMAFKKYLSTLDSANKPRLLRISRKNYLRISKWCEYKTLPEWQYPVR